MYAVEDLILIVLGLWSHRSSGKSSFASVEDSDHEFAELFLVLVAQAS